MDYDEEENIRSLFFGEVMLCHAICTISATLRNYNNRELIILRFFFPSPLSTMHFFFMCHGGESACRMIIVVHENDHRSRGGMPLSVSTLSSM